MQWLDHVAAWLQQQGEAAADDPRSFWIITGEAKRHCIVFRERLLACVRLWVRLQPGCSMLSDHRLLL